MKCLVVFTMSMAILAAAEDEVQHEKKTVKRGILSNHAYGGYGYGYPVLSYAPVVSKISYGHYGGYGHGYYGGLGQGYYGYYPYYYSGYGLGGHGFYGGYHGW